MSPRAVAEWIGLHPDTPVPPRVKVRILHRQDFKCAITGKTITAADTVNFDHIIALINGGENREANLQAILVEAHKVKNKADVALKAKTDAQTKSAFGLNSAPTRKIANCGFPAGKPKREQLPLPARDPTRFNGMKVRMP